jgi:PAS domain S-box-containing protein
MIRDLLEKGQPQVKAPPPGHPPKVTSSNHDLTVGLGCLEQLPLATMRKCVVILPGQLSEEDEKERLLALQRYDVLDSLPERNYEDITELAAFICGTPISLISLVDRERQWFKSSRGLKVSQTPRSESFCANTLSDAQTLIVEDATTDARFRDNPLVVGKPNIRFYAGAPIVEKSGHVLGTVCVIDTEPRILTAKQIAALEALARQVMALLEQRRSLAAMEKALVAAREADRQLQNSERRLQIFVDSLPALAWIANADGWITWFNRRWYEYTGTTLEAMEGWGWQSVHDPQVLPQVIERWTASVRTQQPFEMVFPLRDANGILRAFLTRVVPVRNEAGEVTQWFGTNTEVDELQRTRQSLEENQEVLDQVMKATKDAVVTVNRDWILTYLNPMAEKLYGPAKNLVGRNLWEAFPDSFYQNSPFVEQFYRAMNEGVAGSFEAEFGEPLNLTVGLEVYPAKDGIVTFSRDITKMKLATAAVLQNEKLAAVGRLASSIAHEINNPLESVTNLLYLARGSADPSMVKGYLDTAERELRRVSAIANQTLRFYKQSTRPSLISCASLFQETLLLHQGRLINANIQVEKRQRAARSANCFEGEIRQVLSNLIGNAIDAMHAGGGRLLLRSREATNWQSGQKGLALTVADTGSGMPAHVRRKIFDAFFSTKGIGGTGLGLWVSKEIMDRHQGTLHVRSKEGLDQHGTVFVIFLPFEMAALPAERLGDA